jgi:hypothetical protein
VDTKLRFLHPLNTLLLSPKGRKVRYRSFLIFMKEQYQKKTEIIKLRVSPFDKKHLMLKALDNGLSLSEFVLNSAMNRSIKPSMTSEELEVYKELKEYQTNFARIGNFIKNNDPQLHQEIKELKDEIGKHLKRIMNG